MNAKMYCRKCKKDTWHSIAAFVDDYVENDGYTHMVELSAQAVCLKLGCHDPGYETGITMTELYAQQHHSTIEFYIVLIYNDCEVAENVR